MIHRKITIIFLLVLLCTVFSFLIEAESDLSEDMELIAENNYLSMYLNTETTEIALKDKNSGDIWHTGAADREQKEKNVQGSSQDRLASQIEIIYDRDLQSDIRRDGFNDSVSNDLYNIEKVKNGIRINYTFGKEWKDESYLPRFISRERMEEEILENIDDESDREFFLGFFDLFTVEKLQEDQERLTLSGIDEEVIFEDNTFRSLTPDYIELEEEVEQLVEERENLSKKKTEEPEEEKKVEEEIKKIEESIEQKRDKLKKEGRDFMRDVIYTIEENNYEIDDIRDLTFEEVSHFVDNPTYLRKETPTFRKDQLIEIIKEAGYIPEEVISDHNKNNIDPPQKNLEIFKVPVVHYLEGDNYIVKIPADEVEYPGKVKDLYEQEYNYLLTWLSVLPYFGATHGEEGEGYTFVPAGSGAIIEHDLAENVSSPAYRDSVYGKDFALDPPEQKRVYPEQIYLPVYGLKRGDQAFFAIIEEGESLARINADIGGRSHSYNIVYPEFNLIPKGTTGLSDIGEIDVYQSRSYQQDIKIKFSFLSGEDADYVGMAHCYQKYLKEKYNLQRLSEERKTPFYLDLIGGVPVRKTVMGFPRKVVEVLTSFKQAEGLIEEIGNKINNLNIRFNGWLEGGLTHKYPEKVILESSLGSKNEFEALIETVNKNKNIDFYPDINFLNLQNTGFLDSFNPRQDASHFMDRTPAYKYDYHIATYQMLSDNYSYILSPHILGKTINSFLNDYQEYDNFQFSASSMGLQANSDFRQQEEDLIDREGAVTEITKQADEVVNEKKFDLISEGANAYILPYLNAVLNMPANSSGDLILTEDIPFYQIVVAGYFDYTQEPINISHNPRKSLLKSVETGSAPYFTFTYRDSSILKETEYNNYYSTHYQNWKNKAIDYYQEASTVMDEIQGKVIIDYKKLDDKVYKTEYEDNLSVIVNYRKKPYEYKDVKIKAESFKLVD